MDQLIGRDRELGLLAGARAEAERDEQLRVVVVDGDAGMGKTALVRRFVAGLPACQVLFASADEAERSVPFAVVEQLVAGVPAGRRPPVLRELAVPAGGVPTPAQVGAALAALVAGLLPDGDGASEGSGPRGRDRWGGALVLVVDDAGYADPSSQQALAFALRRLRHRPVLCLLTLLTLQAEQPATLVDGLRRVLAERASGVRVTGLDAAGLGRLSVVVRGTRLPARAAERLREITAGSPLYARALLAELSVGELLGTAGPLPAPRSFGLMVLARLAGCPPATRRLVVAAAVLGMSCSPAAAAELAGLADPQSGLDALGTAVQANLLVERAGPMRARIAFAHPMVRAAVYHDIAPARRAELHLRAADLVADRRVALHHRAEATRFPDDALADELAELAGRDAAGGRLAVAADLLIEASRLTTDRATRERRFTDGVDATFHVGDAARAAAYLEAADPLADRARHHYLAGRLALLQGDYTAGEAELRRGWNELTAAIRPPDPAADGTGRAPLAGTSTAAPPDAATIGNDGPPGGGADGGCGPDSWNREFDGAADGALGAGEAALACALTEGLLILRMRYGSYHSAVPWARRALRFRAAAGSGAGQSSHLPYLAMTAFVACGLLDEAHALATSLTQATAGGAGGDDGSPLDVVDVPGLVRLTRGAYLVAVDSPLAARAELARAADACQREDPSGVLVVVALIRLCLVETRLGEWEAALARAGAAIEAAADHGLPVLMLWGLLARIGVLAARDPVAAGRCADEARRISDELPQRWGEEIVRMAGIRVELARHRFARAADELEWFVAHPGDDLVEPAEMNWRIPYAEALVRLGRLEEADAVLSPVEKASTRRRDIAARAARARVALEWARGHGQAAGAAYEHGAALTVDPDMPFERALLDLEHGTGLSRTARRPLAAAEVLRRARAGLASLQAASYLDRCDAELAACAGPAVRSGPAGAAAAAGERVATAPGLPSGAASRSVPGPPAGPPATSRTADPSRTAQLAPLTPKERETALLAAGGRSNREIAETLVVSVRTVEYHLGNVYTKLHLRSRAQLAALLHPGLGEPGGTTGAPGRQDD